MTNEITNTRTYTRSEQMNSLRRIAERNSTVPIRKLARVVNNIANGRRAEMTVGQDFERDAAALRGVPFATVYNRLRKLNGDLAPRRRLGNPAAGLVNG